MKLQWKEGMTVVVADGVDPVQSVQSATLVTLPIDNVVYGRHGGTAMDPYMMYSIKGVILHKVGVVESDILGR